MGLERTKPLFMTEPVPSSVLPGKRINMEMQVDGEGDRLSQHSDAVSTCIRCPKRPKVAHKPQAFYSKIVDPMKITNVEQASRHGIAGKLVAAEADSDTSGIFQPH